MGRALFGWSLVKENPEVRGYLLAGPARAPLFISFAAISVAMLDLAFRNAGCTGEGYKAHANGTALIDNEGNLANCESNTDFLNFRPDSILSNIAVVASLINIIIIPTAGAIVDYTTYRKQLCIAALSVVWLANFCQAFIGPNTWKLIAISQACFAGPAFMLHQATHSAYSTEVITDLNNLAFLQGAMRVWDMAPMLAFLIVTAIIGNRAGLDVTEKGSLAQIVACTISLPLIVLLGKHLKNRPALHERVEEGKSIITVGIQQLLSTFKMMRTKYPEAAKFLLGLAFFESASISLIQLFTTYLKSAVKVNDPVGYIVIALVCTVPGSISVSHITKRIGVKLTLQIVLFAMMLTTCVVCAFIYGPSVTPILPLLSIIYGFTLGSVQPIQRTFYLLIVPSGSEAEMFGIYIFFGQVINFLPNLIFSFINEKLNSVRLGMLSLAIFHGIGLIIVTTVDFKRARADASVNEHLRIKSLQLKSGEVGILSTK